MSQWSGVLACRGQFLGEIAFWHGAHSNAQIRNTKSMRAHPHFSKCLHLLFCNCRYFLPKRLLLDPGRMLHKILRGGIILSSTRHRNPQYGVSIQMWKGSGICILRCFYVFLERCPILFHRQLFADLVFFLEGGVTMIGQHGRVPQKLVRFASVPAGVGMRNASLPFIQYVSPLHIIVELFSLALMSSAGVPQLCGD